MASGKGAELWARFLGGLKTFFTTNIVIKLVAFVFALLLWGLVLVYQKPVREKVVTDVKIALEGNSDLQSRNLVVVDSDLGTADITVSSEITNHLSLNADRLTCSASLSTINEPGEYTLYLDANVLGGLGTVSSISPATVTITVDSLISKPVAVRLSTVGEIPDGYVLTGTSVPQSITVEGAAQYISPISYAVAYVDVSGLTSSYYSSVNLEFYDESGELLEVTTRSGNVPSALIRLSVTSYKEVPIYLSSQTMLPDETYYITEYTLSSETVVLWGAKETLDGISAIYLEPTVVSLTSLGSNVSLQMQLPGGVQLPDGVSSQVRVSFSISKVKVTRSFNVIVETRNMPDGLELSAESFTVTVSITGDLMDIENVTEDDIYAWIDLAGLEAGEHEVELHVELLRDFDFDSRTAPEIYKVSLTAIKADTE